MGKDSHAISMYEVFLRDLQLLVVISTLHHGLDELQGLLLEVIASLVAEGTVVTKRSACKD